MCVFRFRRGTLREVGPSEGLLSRGGESLPRLVPRGQRSGRQGQRGHVKDSIKIVIYLSPLLVRALIVKGFALCVIINEYNFFFFNFLFSIDLKKW